MDTTATALHQLRGGDAFHLLQESSRQPMHTLKVAVLDVTGGGSSTSLEAIRAWVQEIVAAVPAMRWRLRHAPLHAARPFWVDDGSIDLTRHVRSHTVRAGDSLDGFLGELCGRRLDRDHPLWVLWVIDGFAPDRLALVLQIHHAMADGRASVELWETLASSVPHPVPTPPEPSARTVAAAAGRAQLGQVRRVPQQWKRFRAYLDHASSSTGDDVVTKAFEGPMTRFNKPLSKRRAAAFAALPLADVKAARDHLGCSLNDAYLVLCGGALRRYLQERDELPVEPLTACTPVAVPRGDLPFGNSVTTWYLSLGSDVADPAERVEHVRRSVHATRQATDRDPLLLPDWQGYAVGNMAIVRLMRVVERVRGRPAYNAIVSNVKGPEPFELLGHPVVELRSLGPLSGAMGLNLTAWSYRDDFTIGLHACRDHVPDLDALAAHFPHELEAMLSAAPARTPGRAGR